MIKTIVIPKGNLLSLSIPDNYVGKEIEVLLFAVDEPQKEKPKGNAARFKGLLTEEEANKYDAYLKQARKEWDRNS